MKLLRATSPGFTLIEILISMAALTVLVSTLLVALTGPVADVTRSTKHFADTANLALLMEALHRDAHGASRAESVGSGKDSGVVFHCIGRTVRYGTLPDGRIIRESSGSKSHTYDLGKWATLQWLQSASDSTTGVLLRLEVTPEALHPFSTPGRAPFNPSTTMTLALRSMVFGLSNQGDTRP